jgi:PKD repeat protein
MGHTIESFSDANYLKHLLGGIKIAAGAVADPDCGVAPANQAPTVSVQRNPTGDVHPGDPVAFTGTASDPDGDTLTYEWDFGDGAKATTKDAMHTYNDIGVYFAKLTVHDGHDGSASDLVKVTVTPLSGDNEDEVGVGGVVPGVLSLEVTGSANFGAFVPAVTRDYTATLSAVATSSATAAELTVRDANTRSPGHLINGTRALAQPVQVGATDADHTTMTYAPVPENGSRLRLLAVPVPFSARPITLGFKQHIDASEPLITGGYGKTLTFALSATTP